jgi:hypothetical protein
MNKKYKWYDVEKELPKEGLHVLVNVGENIFEGYYINGRWFSVSNGYSEDRKVNESLFRVKAWHPLPALPKKEKEYPLGPSVRIIQEGEEFVCDKCNSSIKTKWFGFKKLGCINKKCGDYYGKQKNL